MFGELMYPERGWAETQRTPHRKFCEGKYGLCRFCKGISYCTPFTNEVRRIDIDCVLLDGSHISIQAVSFGHRYVYPSGCACDVSIRAVTRCADVLWLRQRLACMLSAFVDQVQLVRGTCILADELLPLFEVFGGRDQGCEGNRVSVVKLPAVR